MKRSSLAVLALTAGIAGISALGDITMGAPIRERGFPEAPSLGFRKLKITRKTGKQAERRDKAQAIKKAKRKARK